MKKQSKFLPIALASALGNLYCPESIATELVTDASSIVKCATSGLTEGTRSQGLPKNLIEEIYYPVFILWDDVLTVDPFAEPIYTRKVKLNYLPGVVQDGEYIVKATIGPEATHFEVDNPFAWRPHAKEIIKAEEKVYANHIKRRAANESEVADMKTKDHNIPSQRLTQIMFRNPDESEDTPIIFRIVDGSENRIQPGLLRKNGAQVDTWINPKVVDARLPLEVNHPDFKITTLAKQEIGRLLKSRKIETALPELMKRVLATVRALHGHQDNWSRDEQPNIYIEAEVEQARIYTSLGFVPVGGTTAVPQELLLDVKPGKFNASQYQLLKPGLASKPVFILHMDAETLLTYTGKMGPARLKPGR